MNSSLKNFLFVVESDLAVPHYEPERLSAAGHLVYMGRREQGVQVSSSHITPITVTRTVRLYQITTGAPLSCFWSESCLAVNLDVFPKVFTFLIHFRDHKIIK